GLEAGLGIRAAAEVGRHLPARLREPEVADRDADQPEEQAGQGAEADAGRRRLDRHGGRAGHRRYSFPATAHGLPSRARSTRPYQLYAAQRKPVARAPMAFRPSTFDLRPLTLPGVADDRAQHV